MMLNREGAPLFSAVRGRLPEMGSLSKDLTGRKLHCSENEGHRLLQAASGPCPGVCLQGRGQGTTHPSPALQSVWLVQTPDHS